jgi:hypothetical protein
MWQMHATDNRSRLYERQQRRRPSCAAEQQLAAALPALPRILAGRSRACVCVSKRRRWWCRKSTFTAAASRFGSASNFLQCA